MRFLLSIVLVVLLFACSSGAARSPGDLSGLGITCRNVMEVSMLSREEFMIRCESSLYIVHCPTGLNDTCDHVARYQLLSSHRILVPFGHPLPDPLPDSKDRKTL